VELFQEHFEAEYSHSEKTISNGNAAHDDFSDYSDAPSPKTQPKPFFRRLSFKGLRKGKSLFLRQHSDDLDVNHEKKEKHSKSKLSKIVVECRKEGIVNYLMSENMDGTAKWEKCRLALVKTVCGYMLEFYSPPKVMN